jgi:hypothetical protein
MKKPKKNAAAAKPQAGRVTASRKISSGKTARAATSGKTQPPKTTPKKAAGTKEEVVPEAEHVVSGKTAPVSKPKRPGASATAKAAVESRVPAEQKRVTEAPPAKMKRVRSKAPEKSKPIVEPAPLAKPGQHEPKAEIALAAKRKRALATVPPPITAKPASLASLVAEAKSEPEKESVSQMSSEAKQAARAGRKAPAYIPPILLEGDRPEATLVSGPGQRYALGPSAPVEKLKTEGELPESYETGEILLTARDPHWLYCHWDLSDDQQRRYNGFSRDGHLIVRVYKEVPGKKPITEVHVHPESRHWFIHVAQANTRYVAELGYYSAADRWKAISTSCGTLTPPDAVSPDASAEFTAIPFEVPMGKLLSLVKETVQENAPLAQALQELRANGHPGLPQIYHHYVEAGPQPRGQTPLVPQSGSRWTPGEWTPAQERALAEVVSMDHVRRVWMGSLEITELIRRQLIHEAGPTAAGELGELAPGAPTSPSGAVVSGISSPTGKEAGKPKGFWFNVNAELIVYGATERDATVSIGGRKIKLRADGSFSYRFALPDGWYEMPIVATSADGTDGRAAELKFNRSTEYRGHVGAHPQDPALKQLLLENF